MFEDGDIKPIVISAIIIANIVINSLVIALMLKYPELREDRVALFMFSLSVSGLAAGCTSMPISAAVCSRATPTVRHMTTYLPGVQLFFVVWFGFTSLNSLCWMTVSKMVAVLKPLRYEQILSRKRCFGIIVFYWICSAVLAATKLNQGAYWNSVSCTGALPKTDKISVLVVLVNFVLFIPSVVLVYATARIVIVVVRTHRAISSQVHIINGAGPTSGFVTLKAIRAAKNILIICFVTLLLTLPIIVIAALFRLGRNQDQKSAYSAFFLMWLFNCNSFMNSLLYLVLFRAVRNKTKRMLTVTYQYLRCDWRGI